MNEDFRLFPYVIRDIVSQVRTKYDSVNLLKPYFEFGTYFELTKRIAIKDSIDAGKYPLIWLVWEAVESMQKWNNSHSYLVNPRVFICNFTNTDFSSVERYDSNFVGVLFPIFDLFKYYLQYDNFISGSGEIKYQLAEHLLWGESLGFQKNQNILFDTLDAIEVKFENLEVNKRC